MGGVNWHKSLPYGINRISIATGDTFEIANFFLSRFIMKPEPSQPNFTRRKYLAVAGGMAWMLLAATLTLLWLLHQAQILNVWQFPLKQIAAFLGGGGLACLFLARFWGFWQHRRWLQRLVWMVAAFFALLNLLAFLFAYSLTHFTPPGTFGIGLPRPVNSRLPSDFGLEYTTDRIPVNDREWLESWFVPAPNPSASKGTILLFPGQGGSKGKQLLAPAQVLHRLGYDTLLVDFRGVGGSSGRTSTIGVREAKDVALAVTYARQLQQQSQPQIQRRSPIVLYGVSMGTAAILQAVARENVTPDAIVLELPFSRLLEAVRVRLDARGIPTFPMAELVVFWGGIQHGFNGFAHNPIDDARQVRTPTLVLHGEGDRWMSLTQIDELITAFPAQKQLTIFPNAGHQLLVTVDRDLWSRSIDRFLRVVGDKF